jgi:membrane protease YdiL (CAAX protease family)
VLAIILLALWMAPSLHADMSDAVQASLEQAQSWEEDHEYEKALDGYKQAGSLGSGLACKKVAYFYDVGRGVEMDQQEALKWYKKASDLLPGDRIVKGRIFSLELTQIISSPNPSPDDVADFRATFHPQLLFGCFTSVLIYILATALLLSLSWRGNNGFFLGTAWVIFFVGSQIIALLALVGSTLPISDTYLIEISAAMSAGPMILAALFPPVRGRLWSKSDCGWKTLAVCVFLPLLPFLFNLGYDQIYQVVTQSPLPEQPTIRLIADLKETSYFLAFAVIAVAMPMAEEILFRGFLFDGLRRLCPGWLAVTVSAAVFSLVHFQPYYFVPLFIFGLMLGIVRMRTKSLRLPFLLHSFNNAFTLAMVS